jgi:hypothetical protein
MSMASCRAKPNRCHQEVCNERGCECFRQERKAVMRGLITEVSRDNQTTIEFLRNRSILTFRVMTAILGVGIPTAVPLG